MWFIVSGVLRKFVHVRFSIFILLRFASLLSRQYALLRFGRSSPSPSSSSLSSWFVTRSNEHCWLFSPFQFFPIFFSLLRAHTASVLSVACTRREFILHYVRKQSNVSAYSVCDVQQEILFVSALRNFSVFSSSSKLAHSRLFTRVDSLPYFQCISHSHVDVVVFIVPCTNELCPNVFVNYEAIWRMRNITSVTHTMTNWTVRVSTDSYFPPHE